MYNMYLPSPLLHFQYAIPNSKWMMFQHLFTLTEHSLLCSSTTFPTLSHLSKKPSFYWLWPKNSFTTYTSSPSANPTYSAFKIHPESHISSPKLYYHQPNSSYNPASLGYYNRPQFILFSCFCPQQCFIQTRSDHVTPPSTQRWQTFHLRIKHTILINNLLASIWPIISTYSLQTSFNPLTLPPTISPCPCWSYIGLLCLWVFCTCCHHPLPCTAQNVFPTDHCTWLPYLILYPLFSAFLISRLLYFFLHSMHPHLTQYTFH